MKNAFLEFSGVKRGEGGESPHTYDTGALGQQ